MSKSGGRFAGPSVGGLKASHEEVQPLLPWYANGTLDEAEQAWVEDHLTHCEECRAEAEDCGALAAAVRSSEITAPAPHPVELARLLARIDAAEEAESGGWGLGPWLRGTLGKTPAAVRWALAAQLALLLGAGVLLGRDRLAPSSQSFHTLADAAAPASTGPELRIVFREDATEAEIRDLLLPLEAEIVAGPSPLGVYTLALPAGADREPLAVVLAHLRVQDAVRFVEAVAPMLPVTESPAGEP